MEKDKKDGSENLDKEKQPVKETIRIPIEASIVASLPSRRPRNPKPKKSKFRKAALASKMFSGKEYIPLKGKDDDKEETEGMVERRYYKGTLTERLAELRKRRSEDDSKRKTSLSTYKTIKINIALFFSQLKFYFMEYVISFEVWKKSLKQIEGSYGNSILSYFTFLKWLLLLDVCVFFFMLLFVVVPQATFQLNPEVQNLTESMLNKTSVNVSIEESSELVVNSDTSMNPTLSPLAKRSDIAQSNRMDNAVENIRGLPSRSKFKTMRYNEVDQALEERNSLLNLGNVKAKSGEEESYSNKRFDTVEDEQVVNALEEEISRNANLEISHNRIKEKRTSSHVINGNAKFGQETEVRGVQDIEDAPFFKHIAESESEMKKKSLIKTKDDIGKRKNPVELDSTKRSQSHRTPIKDKTEKRSRPRRDVLEQPLKVIDIFEPKTKTCHLTIPHPGLSANKTVVELIGDFFQGVGWINTTIMFYGSYTDDRLLLKAGVHYDMPLAYFITGCVYMLISLLMIIFSASAIFEEGYIKKGATNTHSYSNKLFAGWDMCIEDPVAAELKRNSILQNIENSLAEDARMLLLEGEFKRHYCRIFFIRMLVNLTVIVLLAVGAWAIYAATNISLQAQGNSSTNTPEIWNFLESFASSLTVTGLNMILPSLFYFMSKFESWTPRAKMNMDLARTVLIKLASIAVLMSSLYHRAETICMLCWENVIAAEIYKLMWTNFFVIIISTLAVECSRRYFADHVDWGCKLGQKIGRPEFQIPKNVLELVYEQSLIWIGTWYCPMMPLMGAIRFVVFFYVKKFSLFHNCQQPTERYRAERSNYFFMLLLLISFIICLGALTYGVTQIQPSMLYGPFKGFPRMYYIIIEAIETYPPLLKTIFKFTISSLFLILAVFLLCLALYFFYATSRAQRSLIRELQDELDIEKTDKKYLLKTMVQEKMKAKSSSEESS